MNNFYYNLELISWCYPIWKSWNESYGAEIWALNWKVCLDMIYLFWLFIWRSCNKFLSDYFLFLLIVDIGRKSAKSTLNLYLVRVFSSLPMIYFERNPQWIFSTEVFKKRSLSQFQRWTYFFFLQFISRFPKRLEMRITERYTSLATVFIYNQILKARIKTCRPLSKEN